MSEPVVLVVSMEAQPDKVDAMREVLMATGVASRAEEGCLIYQLLEDRKSVGRFTLIEKWRDKECFKKHQVSEHLAAAFKQLESLQARQPEFAPYRALD